MSLRSILAFLAAFGFTDTAYDTPQAQIDPVFNGTLPDNVALNVGSLVTGFNVWANANRGNNLQLGALFGTSDTPNNGRLLVTGIVVEVETGSLTPTQVAALLSNLTLAHKNATRTIYFPLAGYAGSYLTAAATDTTTAAASRLFRGRVAREFKLKGPIWVNGQTDTLLLGTAAAVNLGVTPAVLVTLKGVAFQSLEDIAQVSSPNERQYASFAVAASARRQIVQDAGAKVAAKLLAMKRQG